MRTSFLFVSVLALAACKTDKTSTPATGSGSATGSATAGSATGSGSDGSAVAAAGSGSVITLPKSDGTPPKKREKPVDKEDVDRLLKLDFEGFQKSDRTGPKSFEVRLTTQRPRLAVTVTIAPCFDCVPMELAKWKEKEDSIKAGLLPEELRSLPDTEWELGQADINGAPAIYTYQFGYASSTDQNGPKGAFANAYALYFNDGINQIRAVAEYKDDWVEREDMKRIAPKEDLAKLAKAFVDAYTHAW